MDFLATHDYFIVFSIAIVIFAALIILSFWLWRRERLAWLMQQEFVTVATHKFRTPLTGIKWSIEMLKQDLTFTQKEDVLKRIEEANGRLIEIVDTLVDSLQMNPNASYTYTAASFRELLDETLKKYAELIRKKNIQFTIGGLNQSLPLVIMDRNKIQFVVDMLVDNAIKYTPEGGHITISFAETRSTITLKIKDTGIGISPQDINLIFNGFYRSDRARKVDTEGMGLALHTAQTIVEKHGGKLWAESGGVDTGSTFYLKLKKTN